MLWSVLDVGVCQLVCRLEFSLLDPVLRAAPLVHLYRHSDLCTSSQSFPFSSCRWVCWATIVGWLLDTVEKRGEVGPIVYDLAHTWKSNDDSPTLSHHLSQWVRTCISTSETLVLLFLPSTPPLKNIRGSLRASEWYAGGWRSGSPVLVWPGGWRTQGTLFPPGV